LTKQTNTPTDTDSPWKEALEVYFRPFLLFFFPEIYAHIDWSKGHEFLDIDLQQVAPKPSRGRMTVDKLVKVWRRDGNEAWVLIHIEVQAQPQRGFGRRMYLYNARLFDRYNRDMCSLAVLADDNPAWRPTGYRRELWGCSVAMTFRPVKLLDYAGHEKELEADTNPFAKFVLAHLKAQETRRDLEKRRFWKLRLVRGLYEQGFGPEDVRQLFRLIDWLMKLPNPHNDRFWKEVQEDEEKRRMPYVTTVERIGMRRMLERTLQTKFGEEGAALMPAITELNDADKFLLLQETIVKAATVDEIRRACAELGKPPAPPRKKKNHPRKQP
jgi:hypothetical protein